MDFEERLQKAVERGHRRGIGHREEALARALGEDELKRLHGQYRLDLSEHIEKCLQHLLLHFPGFQCETIYGDRGWGAACSRDDFRVEGRGRRRNDYSRLEMTVRPFNTSHVLELSAKGTIRNKEVFSRTHFEKIEEADPAKFVELIDLWVLEYAELYAART
jgi:hypothetical protein